VDEETQTFLLSEPSHLIFIYHPATRRTLQTALTLARYWRYNLAIFMESHKTELKKYDRDSPYFATHSAAIMFSKMLETGTCLNRLKTEIAFKFLKKVGSIVDPFFEKLEPDTKRSIYIHLFVKSTIPIHFKSTFSTLQSLFKDYYPKFFAIPPSSSTTQPPPSTPPLPSIESQSPTTNGMTGSSLNSSDNMVMSYMFSGCSPNWLGFSSYQNCRVEYGLQEWDKQSNRFSSNIDIDWLKQEFDVITQSSLIDLGEHQFGIKQCLQCGHFAAVNPVKPYFTSNPSSSSTSGTIITKSREMNSGISTNKDDVTANITTTTTSMTAPSSTTTTGLPKKQRRGKKGKQSTSETSSIGLDGNTIIQQQNEERKDPGDALRGWTSFEKYFIRTCICGGSWIKVIEK